MGETGPGKTETSAPTGKQKLVVQQFAKVASNGAKLPLAPSTLESTSGECWDGMALSSDPHGFEGLSLSALKWGGSGQAQTSLIPSIPSAMCIMCPDRPLVFQA